KYFYPLCSNYTCYRHLPSSASENLPVATAISKQVLSLPLYGELNVADIEKICTILLEMRN
ncbi:MAG: DegT/DnrJ/EryC1/StrS family aminotransferase, partial [Chloroflexota bacterium]